jgi:dephospho-CoA kinase
MTIVIGITGGIGSGKTTVCNVFRLLGIPVFEADAEARLLMDTDDILKVKMVDLFGEKVYTLEGKLNRPILANVIFRNNNLREIVNNLVHPLVRKAFFSWLEMKSNLPYIIYEAAILFESGFYKKMDFSILVTAPDNQRIARTKQRDGISEQMVKERMKSQWPEEKKKGMADLCLENDNKNMILLEIIRIDKKLKKDGTIW